jgi:hypothetical protein
VTLGDYVVGPAGLVRRRRVIAGTSAPTSTYLAHSTTCALSGTAPADTWWLWDLRQSITGADLEIVLERATERSPKRGSAPITNRRVHRQSFQGVRSHFRGGPFSHRDVLLQSNGKPDRWHKSIKSERIRPGVLLYLQDAGSLITHYVTAYDEPRCTRGRRDPPGRLARLRNPQAEIHAVRDGKLEQVRQLHQQATRSQREKLTSSSENGSQRQYLSCQVKQKQALRGRNHAEG